MTRRTQALPVPDRGITTDSPRIVEDPAHKDAILAQVRKYVPPIADRRLRRDDPERWMALVISFDAYLGTCWDEYLLRGVQHNLGNRQKRVVAEVREFCRKSRELLP